MFQCHTWSVWITHGRMSAGWLCHLLVTKQTGEEETDLLIEWCHRPVTVMFLFLILTASVRSNYGCKRFLFLNSFSFLSTHPREERHLRWAHQPVSPTWQIQRWREGSDILWPSQDFERRRSGGAGYVSRVCRPLLEQPGNHFQPQRCEFEPSERHRFMSYSNHIAAYH